MGKSDFRIRITRKNRYKREKELGEMYRADQSFVGSFTDFVKMKKKMGEKESKG